MRAAIPTVDHLYPRLRTQDEMESFLAALVDFLRSLGDSGVERSRVGEDLVLLQRRTS